MEGHQIVLRTQSGKNLLSAAKLLHTEKSVVFRLATRCGLSLRLDGTWSEKQLYSHLQEIIKKHQMQLDGEPVHTNKEHVANYQK
ncbi:LOW QUALITY PROTEIN: hypothetical protein PHMEG_0002681 [Phytophthora megakarya]|uniref:Uncharacterized protein n=1 Tax=Phytophthora megakarya TaxID=4795 RepID=A0A225WYI1_9STRA|nr:LOW QUALITY PROTEIN: hypothetical protein PHMEG_0002681 [Phytophthora megakarya]